MSDIALRPVSLSLAAPLAELHAESFGSESWSLDQMKGSLKLASTQGWAAFEGDVAVGFVLTQVTPGEGEILTFCVRPSMQRRGLGENLLRYAIDAARANGSRKIFLEVAADNVAACNLYEKLGFGIAGARPGYYNKRGAVDAIRYQLSIDG